MEIEEVTKKHSRIYRCPDDIANLKIRVRLRESDDDFEETATFKWQEKKFGRFEVDLYKEEKNCSTEIEKRYHEEVKDFVGGENLVFSYVDEDNVDPEEYKLSLANLNKSLQNLSVNEPAFHNAEYNFEKSLLSSIGNPHLIRDLERMYIMADFGEYYESTWLKCEYVLCSLKYDSRRKTMLLYPDYTSVNPYIIQINGDSSRKVEYWLENASLDGIERNDLLKDVEVLNKMSLHDRFRVDRILGEFKLPDEHKLHVHVFLEILGGKNFDNDNVYVQYYLDLPKNWKCLNDVPLMGVTPSSFGRFEDGDNFVHFGFPVDFFLEYNTRPVDFEGNFQSPYVYFEVISKETWSRYRTEGLTYQKLPISRPGVHRRQLQCLRIACRGPVGNLRRFFIGDCGNYDDIAWIGVSGNQEDVVINKHGAETVGAGQLNIKLNVIHQTRPTTDGAGESSFREKYLLEKLNDSNLMKSVEQVLEAFKRARNNMLEARKRLS